MENIYQTIKFKIEDVELDINYSPEDKTVWLTQKQIATLFGKARSAIIWHIKNIITETTDSDVETINTTPHRSIDKIDTSPLRCVKKLDIPTNKMIKHYDLETVLEIGRRIGSDRGLLLKKFLDDYLNQEVIENKQDIIMYNNGNIKLDVKISPDEDTVWLNQAQIAELFETTQPNVSLHINNIYETGELEVGATYKDFLIVQLEGGRKVNRKIAYYNLDMIISLGYRVNTSRGIEFRRWATSVLKRYLYKGYVIDEERIALTKSVANLENEVERIKEQIKDIKERTFTEPIKEKLFRNGEFFDSRELLSSIVENAKESIIIIDPYFDIVSLSYLKNVPKSIHIKVIRSFRGHLNKEDLRAFRRQYRDIYVALDETFHDRFILIDKKECYLLGTSTNGLGKRTSAIIRITNEKIINDLIEMVKTK